MFLSFLFFCNEPNTNTMLLSKEEKYSQIQHLTNIYLVHTMCRALFIKLEISQGWFILLLTLDLMIQSYIHRCGVVLIS